MNELTLSGIKPEIVNQLFNSSKSSRGRWLERPINLVANQGTWCIARIESLIWSGPNDLTANVIMSVDQRSVRVRLDIDCDPFNDAVYAVMIPAIGAPRSITA